MGKIVLLDELTINQIAAGEVIERPASVIKEMVENSIDAGAKNINIEIKNGGISYINVTDDGKGILPDDMEIAFERHATSKIRVADDLKTVKSMGFRGEALASIASIANVEMISRNVDEEIGNKIIVEAGDILEKEEIGAPVGTSITVTKLFFNTPVRYKFLKKDFTEAGYIEDAITRLAIANPGISFKLINSGKVVIKTTGSGNLKDVIYSIYGKDVAEGLIDVNYLYEDIIVKGVVGKPDIARSNRSNQLFYINNRYVKDKTLSSAIERSFKGLLPIGKYPFLVLDLDMDSSKVDVNVHPTKLEVRFEEEQKVFKAVYHAVKEALLKNDLVPESEKSYDDDSFKIKSNSFFRNSFNTPVVKKENDTKIVKEEINPEETMKKLMELKEKIQSFERKPSLDKIEENKIENKDEENLDKEKDSIDNKVDDNKNDEQESPDKLREQFHKIVEENTNILEEIHEERKEKEKYLEEQEKNIFVKLDELNSLKTEENDNFDEMYEKTFGKLPKREKEVKNDEIETFDEEMQEIKNNNLSIFEENEEYKVKPNYRFIGIAFKTYIIIEVDNEIYMIDQHAAHERILYEKVKKNFYEEEEKDSQLMILPDVITLSHKDMNIAKDNMQLFRKAGFMIDEFGENTVKISGTPSILLKLDTKELFLEILDEINSVARTAKQEIENKFIATIACKAAVKAGMDLSVEEVEKLIDKLLVLPNPFTCPHGRPTTIKMTKSDLEKKFSRRK